MANKNEIAETENNYNLVTMTDSISEEAILEEMNGLGSLTFDRIKIPSGGGLAFELPGEDDDNPEIAKEIICVILDHGPINAYWANEYSGENAAPDCSSYDGKTGIDRETGEARDCQNCPHNQFGSDGGRGKECKNIHRIYLLQEGNPVPMILSLPPTSISNFRDYIGKKITLRGSRCWEVITKISLKKDENANGVSYSKAVFSRIGTLTPEEAAKAKGMRELIRNLDQPVAIDNEDYAAGPATDKDGFVEVPEGENEELPFN